MKLKSMLITILAGMCFSSYSQNYIQNANLEAGTLIPNDYDQLDYATGWSRSTCFGYSTPDLFDSRIVSVVTPACKYDIPVNKWATNIPVRSSGFRYTGFADNEAIMGSISPLHTSCFSYNLSFYVHTIDGYATPTACSPAGVTFIAPSKVEVRLVNSTNCATSHLIYISPVINANGAWQLLQTNFTLTPALVANGYDKIEFDIVAPPGYASGTTLFMDDFSLRLNVPDAGPGATICAGQSTTLSGSGGGTYSWAPTAGLSCTTCASPIANPGTTTTYTLTVNGGSGCIQTDTVTVTVNPLPVIPITNILVCQNDTMPILDAGAGGASYAWTYNGTPILGNQFAYTASYGFGSYAVTVTSPAGCSASETISVTQSQYGQWMITTANGKQEGNNIALDAAGNIYIVGTFESSILLSGNACTVTANSAGTTSKSAYIAKYNACGELQWVNYEDALGWSEGRGIAVDKSSLSVYITGPCRGPIHFQSTAAVPCGGTPVPAADINGAGHYIAKFSMITGALLNNYISPALPSGHTDFEANAIAVKGNLLSGTAAIYVCGSQFETASNSRKANIIKYNLSGGTFTQSWIKVSVPAANTISIAKDVALNGSENRVYITGEFQNKIEFPGIAPVSNVNALKDAFIGAFDVSTGTPTAGYLRAGKASSGESASGSAIAMDETNAMYYTGEYTGVFNILNPLFGFGFGSYLTGAPGRKCGYIIRVNNNTVSTPFIKQIQATSPGNAVARGITVNSSEILVTGNFFSTNMAFPANNAYTGNPGYNKAYVASFDRTTLNLNWGNVTKVPVSSNSYHLAKAIVSNDEFSYTIGDYSGILDYSWGSPASGPLNSLGQINSFIIRNDLAGGGEFRITENTEEGIIFTDEENVGFRIYPNPTKGTVSIQVTGSQETNNLTTIKIMDVMGRIVADQNITSGSLLNVDLSKYGKGLYIVVFSNGNKTEAQKVIVD